MTLPVLGPGAPDARDLDAALREFGGFLWEPSFGSALHDRALAAAHEFFALPQAAKASLAIEKSPHFRGWSEMHNERDWREQIHLGRDRNASYSQRQYELLEGPNLWPASPTWRDFFIAYMDAVADLGEAMLNAIAEGLDIGGAPFEGVGAQRLFGDEADWVSSAAFGDVGSPRSGSARRLQLDHHDAAG
jgi:isopenicillin N synthase-like dioxygenase